MLWTYKCPKPVFSSPALLPSSDCIVIGCVDGGVYVIASNGQHVSLLPVEYYSFHCMYYNVMYGVCMIRTIS